MVFRDLESERRWRGTRLRIAGLDVVVMRLQFNPRMEVFNR
jgi:hypothetical protein